MTNEYKSALARIKKTPKTEEALTQLQKSFDRIYEAGFFGEKEYLKLSNRLFDLITKASLKKEDNTP